RACQGCGLSMEDFDIERARAVVARYREPREAARFGALYARWQAFVGLLLLIVALIVGRFEPRARRPALAFAAAAGCATLAPAALACYGVRSRQRQRRRE